jgi:hypothetical protein
MSDATGTGILSSRSVAALSESGRYLAVGDRVPPFLRILDQETGAARAFGPKRQGTGELMSACGLDGNEGGVLLWHRAREPQLGYWLPCHGSAASVWSHTPAREVIERRITLDGGTTVAPSWSLFFDTVFHGAAASGSTKIRTRFAIKPFDGVPVTQFHTVQGTLCREVEIFVNWRLHDAHRDGLVVSALEPHPIVQVIDWEWFRASLARVKCSE